MTDKAVHENDVLREMIPQATQLLCQWHVLTWLNKQAAHLAKPVSKEVKALMSLLVYAKSEEGYEDSKGAMLQMLSEQYIAEFNRVGGRPSGLNEDPELAALALQISDFALRLVSEEHALATGSGADYTVNMGNAKENHEKAFLLATKYREGRVGRLASFDQVAALLDGPYSMFHTKAMLDNLVIPIVEVRGKLSVRSYAVGQDIPVVKSIPQMNKIMEAIEAIKIRDGIDLLDYWPVYGFATFDQLDGMDSVIEARNHFSLVMQTMRWIDDVEWRVSDIRKPFSDARSVTKNEHKNYVETLSLGVNRAPGKFVSGHQLLDSRENLWLHTTSILVSMMALRDEYPDAGLVSPIFHEFVSPEQRKRVAGGFGAGNPQYQRVIGIFNVGNHWVAFLVDRHIQPDTNNGVCFMFDPLQSQHSYTIVERSDGSSCGVWCIAILEILLSGASWDDCLYNLLPYLRMRFLYKAIAFIGKQAAS
ncbi:hypothetical protein GN958_ATG00779 [Phytophthora infestans]|uniref:Ubiquitin-like protease family profile domain-containing protein n=1 Tax=Phytophthora infestans TaxID=4787 RepID=A0A8S9VBV5_PHYIN|nr:hypothetical protein GN958_ATG00779 [Phytophthora infestans]